MITKLSLGLHTTHNRIVLGWQSLSPYFYITAFGSTQEAVLAKLFPNYFYTTATGTAIFYCGLFYLLYYIGDNHEKLEKKT